MSSGDVNGWWYVSHLSEDLQVRTCIWPGTNFLSVIYSIVAQSMVVSEGCFCEPWKWPYTQKRQWRRWRERCFLSFLHGSNLYESHQNEIVWNIPRGKLRNQMTGNYLRSIPRFGKENIARTRPDSDSFSNNAQSVGQPNLWLWDKTILCLPKGQRSSSSFLITFWSGFGCYFARDDIPLCLLQAGICITSQP